MVDPRKIKITLPIAGSDPIGSWMVSNGHTMESNLMRSGEGGGGGSGGEKIPGFHGQEEESPKEKALKKIQIEIRRNIKSSGSLRDRSPVRRSLKSYDTLQMPRRKDEGSIPLFDQIASLIALNETKRIISLDDKEDSGRQDQRVRQGGGSRDRGRDRRRSRSRSRSRSPLAKRGLYSEATNKNGGNKQSSDVKSRLGFNSRNNDNERRNSSSGQNKSVHSRLGHRRSPPMSRHDKGRNVDQEDDGDDDDRVLGREELESQRPVAPPPWEINPEIVPRGNYFEHDDREGDDEPSSSRATGRARTGFRGGGFGGFGGGKSNFRGRSGGARGFRGGGGGGGGNRGFFNRKRGRGDSPEWKHDKFHEAARDDT